MLFLPKGDYASVYFPQHDVSKIAGFVHVENDDRDSVIHAKAESRRVHYLEPLRQRFGKGEVLKTLGVRVHVRVAIVNAVDLRRLQDDVGANLARAKRRGRVGREIRIAGACDENDHAPQFEMANRASEDERFGDVFHLDRCLHACFDAGLDKRALQREAVDHSCEHSHVISRRAIHAAVARGDSTPNVAAADHHGRLHAEILHLFDALCNLAHDLRGNVFAGAAFAKGFTA